MRTRFATLSLLAAATLACGGLTVDDRVMLADLVDKSEHVEVVNLFLLSTQQLGVVNARCTQCLEPYTMASAEVRQMLGAKALLEPTCLCPSTCASGVLEEVAALEPVQRMEKVAATCDAEGPDPLFRDDLAALRPRVDAIDYAVMRMLLEPMEGTDELTDMHETLAVGLALRGAPWPEASDELVVIGHDPEPFEALAHDVDDCERGLSNRLVVRPDGTVARVGGLGCSKSLAALELPGEGWRVVDVAWSAEGIDAYLASDEAPEPPPVDLPKGGKAKAPGKKGGTMKMGTPSVKGGLSPDLVNRVVRRNANQLNFCFQRAFAKDPTLQGELTVTFVVAADGNVASSKVAGGMGQAVDGCIVGRFQRMVFPKPSGGGIATVSYPLSFSP